MTTTVSQTTREYAIERWSSDGWDQKRGTWYHDKGGFDTAEEAREYIEKDVNGRIIDSQRTGADGRSLYPNMKPEHSIQRWRIVYIEKKVDVIGEPIVEKDVYRKLRPPKEAEPAIKGNRVEGRYYDYEDEGLGGT